MRRMRKCLLYRIVLNISLNLFTGSLQGSLNTYTNYRLILASRHLGMSFDDFDNTDVTEELEELGDLDVGNQDLVEVVDADDLKDKEVTEIVLAAEP
ncbi:hypothetical protein BKA61DRAFT_603020 [Leptodontidium sp. MPI-SDFR-AT-0119]|nr:hypothetical protein BKA61DRAFT_603020 [Leptodontidium sp. MPI-SDFR-AT-0119]